MGQKPETQPAKKLSGLEEIGVSVPRRRVSTGPKLPTSSKLLQEPRQHLPAVPGVKPPAPEGSRLAKLKRSLLTGGAVEGSSSTSPPLAKKLALSAKKIQPMDTTHADSTAQPSGKLSPSSSALSLPNTEKPPLKIVIKLSTLQVLSSPLKKRHHEADGSPHSPSVNGKGDTSSPPRKKRCTQGDSVSLTGEEAGKSPSGGQEEPGCPELGAEHKEKKKKEEEEEKNNKKKKNKKRRSRSKERSPGTLSSGS
ncbi:ubiquitin carboxyl-terminal hydrolase 36-like isoform X2 [Phaenicophaeus curvirostris]|uniref:ubiquitin carboxyl-terminal hydrolase 36-like isoform X2 n=1 Tax=Phaenicophaeus curvirostris TaxID=33595 RepID=UPI0037F0F2E3